MALAIIEPFTYETFADETGEFISELVDHFKKTDPEYWFNSLKRYSFNGKDYERGGRDRLQFNKNLSSFSGSEELFSIADKILTWGRMGHLNNAMKQRLESSLSSLELLAKGESIDPSRICVERLASITKVYEMWDLDNWVIYDSYCARGLQHLINQMWKSEGRKQHEDLLKLPLPPGRSGFPPEHGFVGNTSLLQQRLGFVYASWLCKSIAERLNDCHNGGFHWRPYHVEMLAFQIGHEVTR